MDGIERLAAHVVATTWDRVPPRARAAAKALVVDSLAVAVAATAEPWVPGLLDAAASWGAAPESQVWGRGRRLPAPAAALVNAALVHGLEFDAVHEGAVVHPMATLLPALLAHAERRGGLDGAVFLTAVVAGVDVACALGLASRAPMRFYRPGTAGAFGAVAALGKADGLDAATLVSAFGLVAGQVSGTLQAHAEGSVLVPLQVGVNARAALTAHDLATRGLAGPRQVLEGPYGYLRLFEGDAWDLDSGLAQLGRAWRVIEVTLKPFPSGRLTHGAADALLRLAAEHGLDARQVQRVTARVPPLVHRLVGRPALPRPTAAYARLCLPHVAAVALLTGDVDVADFRGDRLADARVRALAERIEVVGDGNPDPNAMLPLTVEVALRDGRRLATRLEAVLGHPRRPLAPARHEAKLRRCWALGAAAPPARVEALMALVERIEAVADVAELAALLAG